MHYKQHALIVDRCGFHTSLLHGHFSLKLIEILNYRHILVVIVVNFIKSQLFWTVLLYYISIVLGEALTEERNPQEQQFFRIAKGA